MRKCIMQMNLKKNVFRTKSFKCKQTNLLMKWADTDTQMSIANLAKYKRLALSFFSFKQLHRQIIDIWTELAKKS